MSPTPKGKSPSNMGQIMAMARKMSDAQLADVLQGKSLDVPQFAAMTEAMGRKSLRNAVQGMEAKGQAQQPSLKDKLLAEESTQQMPTIPGMEPQTVMAAGGGLTSIPAPNMESMDMASGGIIAFGNGGDIEERRKAAIDVINQNMPEKAPSNLNMSLTEYYNLRNKALKGIDTNMPLPVSEESKQLRESTYGRRFAPPVAKDDSQALESGFTPTPSLASTPFSEDKVKEEQQQQRQQLNANPNPRAGVNPTAGVNPSAATLGGVDEEIAKYADKYSKMFPEAAPFVKRENPFSAVKYEGDSADKTREQGLGAGLMMAASGLLKNPTFAGGLGDAMMALGNQGWITAKEVKAAQKDEREFNKDMAKASEFFEQGQEEKAIKYATLAQHRQDKVMDTAINTLKAKTDLFSAQSTADYQKGKLAVDRMQAGRPDSGMALLNRVLNENKGMSTVEALNAIAGAKNPKLSTISPETALKEYNDRAAADITGKFEKRFPTPSSYYNFVQQSSAQQQPKFLGFE
jgi:hypothetical protein